MIDERVASDEAAPKLRELGSWLSDHRPLVAFSGGVDSTFLAYMAHAFSPGYLAVTVSTPLCPSWELEEAPRIARELGLRHKVVSLDVLAENRVSSNPRDRCYHCKKMILGRLIELAPQEGLTDVVDGTNADDLEAHRPGRRALEELGVRSPLAAAGLAKVEIRRLSEKLGLPTWGKEASPCLATRIPYGERLERKRLKRIDLAESHIRQKGYRVVRVRDHGEIARIELGEDELRCLDLEGFRSEVVPHLQSLGYRFVALDLSPYRSGAWDDSHEPIRMPAKGREGSF